MHIIIIYLYNLCIIIITQLKLIVLTNCIDRKYVFTYLFISCKVRCYILDLCDFL